jgi:hypothetical protein
MKYSIVLVMTQGLPSCSAPQYVGTATPCRNQYAPKDYVSPITVTGRFATEKTGGFILRYFAPLLKAVSSPWHVRTAGSVSPQG